MHRNAKFTALADDVASEHFHIKRLLPGARFFSAEVQNAPGQEILAFRYCVAKKVPLAVGGAN
jgi:hypothetical protein